MRERGPSTSALRAFAQDDTVTAGPSAPAAADRGGLAQDDTVGGFLFPTLSQKKGQDGHPAEFGTFLRTAGLR